MDYFPCFFIHFLLLKLKEKYYTQNANGLVCEQIPYTPNGQNDTNPINNS